MRKVNSYAHKRTTRGADRYGTYTNGRLTVAEHIAGTTIDRQLRAYLTNGGN